MVKKTNLKNIKENISELSKKPELWIGVITILVIAVVSGSFILNNIKKSKLTNNSENQELFLDEMDIEKDKSVEEVTKTTNEKATITKLADTNGEYIVQNGDNYWKISEKVCGNGKYFESISADNNFITLHAGDVITVNCR